MKLLLASLVGIALAQDAGSSWAVNPTPGTLATGPHKAGFWAESTLPQHTIFAPISPPAGLKLPVLIWGNGACSSNGTYFRRSLFQVASNGFFVIANGAPTGGKGQTTSKMQIDSLNWIKANAGKGKFAAVDGTRIAAAGQSCGGLETYEAAISPQGQAQISVVGIFNSGEFGSSVKSKKVTQPIFYFLGGSSDIAYANGERDYKNLAASHPKWKGNLPVGHMVCKPSRVRSPLTFRPPGAKRTAASSARLRLSGSTGRCVGTRPPASSLPAPVRRRLDGAWNRRTWTRSRCSRRMPDWRCR
ncbi:hypothetical protein EJ06DRAFT_517336 [Trichodelitschia bisporula]|uniref:Alpha/beta-hydrolase n=1 Tax=Trichodelitschia bisporula TaxID=703511 RepID=A0A6G1HJ14_9PEZI|nr:hypothetical protein EJ06DRAFT_517336 [Trichodelitschia bisporula]